MANLKLHYPVKVVRGFDGATFFPQVSAEGILSWSNDKELENPDPVNLKGAKGDPGEKGETGSQGEKGDPGISVTHTWDGTTLTITSASGSTSADLKGEKGEKGDRGLQGEKGETGEKGERGLQGEKGDTGAKGDTYVLTDADKNDIADLIPVEEKIQEACLPSGAINKAVEEILNTLTGNGGEDEY